MAQGILPTRSEMRASVSDRFYKSWYIVPHSVRVTEADGQ